MPTVGGKGSRVIVGGLLALVMVLGTAACGGGGGDERTADVVVRDEDTLRFTPDRLQIDLDQETTFSFLNNDDLVHNFTVPALFVDVDAQPGERVSVPIPAVAEVPRDGFFSFYCKYHQSEGMSGRINISR